MSYYFIQTAGLLEKATFNFGKLIITIIVNK